MSAPRAALVLTVLALASAGAVALLSRTPAALREQTWDAAATAPGLGARFSDEQVRRGRAYNRPRYLGFVLATLLGFALLIALARGPWGGIVDRVEGSVPGGWAAHAVVLAVVVVVLSTAVALPLSYVRGFAIEHAWGLSTQDVGGWAADRLRSLVVSAVVSAVAALAFFGVVRWQPRAWWLWGWGAFTALTAVLMFLYPVAIAPLFNRFTPLADGRLASAARALAQRAGVEVDEVLVADASRRTRATNAYVAGLGSTRRLVVYDTLLEAGDDEVLYVVGHELGHEVHGHVVKGVFLSALGLLVGFAGLAWLAEQAAPWRWAGAEGITDLRALPLLLLYLSSATVVMLPVENALSRAFERQADATAVELTEDPAAAVRVLRRLALSNIADLEPPRAAVALLYTHPPIPARIRDVSSGGKTEALHY